MGVRERERKGEKSEIRTRAVKNRYRLSGKVLLWGGLRKKISYLSLILVEWFALAAVIHYCLFKRPSFQAVPMSAISESRNFPIRTSHLATLEVLRHS